MLNAEPLRAVERRSFSAWFAIVVLTAPAAEAVVNCVLLAAVGFATAPRPGVRAFSLAFLAVTLLSHVVLIVVWRYRIPYWDPVLLLYGVFGAGTLLPSWKRST